MARVGKYLPYHPAPGLVGLTSGAVMTWACPRIWRYLIFAGNYPPHPDHAPGDLHRFELILNVA
jgi:hypothetical protein